MVRALDQRSLNPSRLYFPSVGLVMFLLWLYELYQYIVMWLSFNHLLGAF